MNPTQPHPSPVTSFDAAAPLEQAGSGEASFNTMLSLSLEKAALAKAYRYQADADEIARIRYEHEGNSKLVSHYAKIVEVYRELSESYKSMAERLAQEASRS